MSEYTSLHFVTWSPKDIFAFLGTDVPNSYNSAIQSIEKGPELCVACVCNAISRASIRKATNAW